MHFCIRLHYMWMYSWQLPDIYHFPFSWWFPSLLFSHILGGHQYILLLNISQKSPGSITYSPHIVSPWTQASAHYQGIFRLSYLVDGRIYIVFLSVILYVRVAISPLGLIHNLFGSFD